jgi:ParB family chromosome partitioning protein
MGRGLAAILAVSDVDEREQELRDVPVELIAPNPNQPRRRFDEEALEALAGSLGERGMLQPILVRPKHDGSYELIAGERRWRAAQRAGLSEIPAIVRRHDDSAALELALIENMARENLTPVEEARACAALVEELGLTQADVGRRVGRGRVAVANLLRLLELPDEALELLERGTLSAGHGRAALLASDHGARRRLAREAAIGGWTVRKLEQEARASNEAHKHAARAPRAIHPDQEAACAEIAQGLEAALGAEVHVRPAGDGYRATLAFSSADEARALSRRFASIT